jgi:hypothetical protein
MLAPPESKERDPGYSDHYNWLFHLELPLMLGVVDKKRQELSLYSTLPAWFLYHERFNECGVIELVPHPSGSVDKQVGVDRPKDCGVEAKAGGRKRFEVHLGFPMIVLNVNELGDKELLKRKKHSLRRAIELGTQITRFARMGTLFFWWFNVTIPTGFVYENTNPDGYNGGVAWFVGACRNPDQLGEMMTGIAPGLMSAALLFKNANRPDLLKSLREAMRILPGGSVPPEIQKELPEIFGS